MKPIEQLLREEIGLDAASVGSSLVERSIRLRMKALGLAHTDNYRELLTTSRAEWDELIESVVVTETWFFRDHEPFSVFAQLATERLKSDAQSPTAKASNVSDFRRMILNSVPLPLRVLSLPCSTGEEPYSLAMALLDAGVSPGRFTIDAVDLSARALERARVAVYGKNSFRGKGGPGGSHLEFRQRHFTATDEGFQLRDNVRACVTFHRGNLLDGNFFADRPPYDFIFCRNLLIYFDRPTQATVLRKLHRLLAETGVLFVGPAEMPLVAEHNFAPAGLPMAFACRKRTANSEANPQRPATGLPPAGQRPLPRRAAKAAPKLPPPAPITIALPEPETKHPATRAPGPELLAARALADAGKLLEAAALCEAHLQSAGPSAQAYYLLGLTRDAQGDPTALEYYRKALYLEPDHYESLLQLSLLLEKQGDAAAARSYKRRAQRVQKRES